MIWRQGSGCSAGSERHERGLSIGLAIMDWFGQKVLEYPETTGNLLFAAVADQEAYSAG